MSRPIVVVQAQRLRCLGRFTEALASYESAIAEPGVDSLGLRTEMCAMMLEQGLVRKCHETLIVARETFGDDDPAAPLADMLVFTTDAITQLQFRDNLRKASSLYMSHLADRPAGQFDKMRVSMLCYVYLVNIAEEIGVDVSTAPLPSLRTLKAVFRHMLEEKRYWNAIAVAKQFASLASQPRKRVLLDELIGHLVASYGKRTGNLNDRTTNLVVRAEASAAVASELITAERKKEALTFLAIASKLYDEAGHVTGSCLMNVRRTLLSFASKPAARRHQRDAILEAKSRLESFENYADVRETINVLYEFAMADQDVEFHMQLDDEMRRLADLRGCPLDWATQSQLIASRWHPSGIMAAKIIQPYEAMYNQLEGKEVPRILSMIAKRLTTAYEHIGDSNKAREWQQQSELWSPEIVPRHAQFLNGLDVFYKALETATEVQGEGPRDLEQEIQSLEAELRRMEEYLDPDAVSQSVMYHGIMKLTLMCDLYLNQVRFRGFKPSRMLVETCLEHAEYFIDLLPSHQKLKWQGLVAQKEARLLFTHACLCGGTHDKPDVHLLRLAVARYQESVNMEKRAGDVLQHTFVLQNLATSSTLLWSAEGGDARSPHFRRAVESLEMAAKNLQAQNEVTIQRTTYSNLLDLWYRGVFRSVPHGNLRPVWRWLGLGLVRYAGRALGIGAIWVPLPQKIREFLRVIFFTTPLDEVVRVLFEAEALLDTQRRDLSTLPGPEAIRAKQYLRVQENVKSVFERAVVIFSGINDTKRLWEWIQRSKARSVSDLLGIGVNMPSHLRERIAADALASSLLAADEALRDRLRDAAPADKFAIRREIELNQARMRTNIYLAEVLDLREGVSVTWERLARLKNRSAEATGRKEQTTWYFDWLTVGDAIHVVAVSDAAETYHIDQCQMAISDVVAWADKHISGYDEPLSDEEDSLPALAALKPLVELVLRLAKDDDRLVFCPTAPLHCVPLHAIVVESNPDDPIEERIGWKTIIERHPVVYASSMTIYEQSTNRRLDQLSNRQMSKDQRHIDRLRGAAVAVYEEAAMARAGREWESERADVYAACTSISQDLGWPAPSVGTSVTSQTVASMLATSDVALFYGHFYDAAENVLERGIVLHPQENNESETEHEHEQENGHEHERKHESQESSSSTARTMTTATTTTRTSPPAARVFTVSDMFMTDVHAAHVTLIACASANEAVSPVGDEPLGIVTALLYAGTTSVAGTMWRIWSGTGRIFAARFFEELKKNAAEEGAVVDVAVAMQRAVRYLRRMRKGRLPPYAWACFVLHGAWCL